MKLFLIVTPVLILLSFSQGSEVIPLKLMSSAQPKGWKHLAFSNGKSHSILETKAGGLKISVDSSSGPLVYRFSKAKPITGLRFKGATNGLIPIPKGEKQGDEGYDDFVLRMGVITAGERKLNRLQTALAPNWVKELSRVTDDQSSLGKILFFNVENDPGTGWEKRIHPQSKGLIEERIVSTLKQAGTIDFEVKFKQSLNVIGLWVACDGDDTNSRFELLIDQIHVCED